MKDKGRGRPPGQGSGASDRSARERAAQRPPGQGSARCRGRRPGALQEGMGIFWREACFSCAAACWIPRLGACRRQSRTTRLSPGDLAWEHEPSSSSRETTTSPRSQLARGVLQDARDTDGSRRRAVHALR